MTEDVTQRQPGTGNDLRRNADFRTFFVARSVSMFGNAMTPIALSFAVLEQENGARNLGLVLAAQMVPMLLFTIVGGGLADRVSRSSILFWSNLGAGITQCTLAAVLLVDVHLALILILAASNGTAEAFTTPALRGFLGEVVPTGQLTRANSLLSTTKSVARIAGPGVAGLLIAVFSGSAALAIDGVAFIVSAVLMRSLSRSRSAAVATSGGGGETFLQDLRLGWGYFRATRWIWTVTLSFALLNFIQAGAWLVLGPVIAASSIGSSGWGLVLSAKAVGLLLVSALLVRFADKKRLSVAMASMCLAGLPIVALGVSANTIVLASAALIAGGVSAYFGIVWDTALQSRVPGSQISRISSFDDLGAFVTIPAAQLLAWPLASQFGSATVTLVGGCLFVALALVPLAFRSVRRS